MSILRDQVLNHHVAHDDYWLRLEYFGDDDLTVTLGESYAGNDVGFAMVIEPRHYAFAVAWLTAMAYRHDEYLDSINPVI